MRALHILGAFLVLGCNLVVSFSHTLDLFRAGGFRGGLEYVGAVGVETVFLMGAFSIVYARLKGQSPDIPSIMGGLLGVALVSWSNVRAGLAYGWTGILLGLSTPASLVVAEAILSRALVRWRVEAGEREAASGRVGELKQAPAKMGEPTPGRMGDRPLVGDSREMGDRREKREISPAPTPSPTKREMGDPKREAPTKEKREKAAATASSHSPTSPAAAPTPAPMMTDSGRKRETGASPTPTDLSHLVKVAREIMEREGRCGRVRLQRETGAPEHQCRQALKILREQVG